MANRKIKAELEFQGKDSTSAAFRSVAARMGQIERQIGAFNRTAGAFDARVRQIQRSVSGFERAARGVDSAFSGIRAGMGLFAAYGVGQAVKGAITDFGALERQMTRIGITADASAQQTTKAFEQAQQIAKDLKYDSVQPAIEALETLVASGKTLEEALAFLPSVLSTAQASGAATADIANTGLKAASALKIASDQLQRSFDIMVAGGKAGQFELKDMAQYIPTLANSFASLGYEGEPGLKKLVALLQTLREDTGNASDAATQAQNIFGKIYSEETGNKFAKFGINLRKEMDAARKAGEDTLTAFTKITEKALNGDMSKLSLLFSDEQFRLGMQSLLTSQESLQKFMETLNSAEVDGTVFRDLRRVLSDTQADIDDLANSWNRLKTSFGQALAENGGTGLMNFAANQLDYATAVNKGLGQKGMDGWWARTGFGLTSNQMEKDRMAVLGGYKEPGFLKDYNLRLYESGQVRASTGRQNMSVVTPDFPGGATGAIPVPGRRPARQASQMVTMPYPIRGVPQGLRADAGSQPGALSSFFSMPSAEQFRDAMKMDVSAYTKSGEEAGRAVADGGREAGQKIEESAAFIRVAGYDVSTAIANAAQKMLEAARAFNAQPVIRPVALPASSGVKADTGRSMPQTTFGPR